MAVAGNIAPAALDVLREAAAGGELPGIWVLELSSFQLDDVAGLPATVRVVEPTGSETQVEFEFGGHAFTGVFRERITAGPGENLGITPDTNVTHLFDAGTGKRIVT